MMKKELLRYLSVLALLLMPGAICAQEEVADTVSVDGLTDEGPVVAQYDLSECDWVDICYNPKYAIVTKDGKKGVYDLVRNKNITEIEYRELGYSKDEVDDDSIRSCWFFAKKGCKMGIICVLENSNDMMSFWTDDPEEVYSLDGCTTIDEKMAKRTKKLLQAFISRQHMDNAQIVILDTKTGRLKTWIAMDADMRKEDAGKLLAHSCSASLSVPFREGRPLRNHSLKATDPLTLAMGYNSLFHDGALICPTLKADSVMVEEGVITPEIVERLRNNLRVDRHVSSPLEWLYDGAEWVAYATSDLIYDESDKNQERPIGVQLQFAGVFPVDNPRYTICVIAEKQSPTARLDLLQDLVNPLAKWLKKK